MIIAAATWLHSDGSRMLSVEPADHVCRAVFGGGAVLSDFGSPQPAAPMPGVSSGISVLSITQRWHLKRDHFDVHFVASTDDEAEAGSYYARYSLGHTLGVPTVSDGWPIRSIVLTQCNIDALREPLLANLSGEPRDKRIRWVVLLTEVAGFRGIVHREGYIDDALPDPRFPSDDRYLRGARACVKHARCEDLVVASLGEGSY